MSNTTTNAAAADDDGVVVRRAVPAEVEAAARVCVDGFKAFNDSVGLPDEFPGGVPPVGMLQFTQQHPSMELFVAVDAGGHVVGTCSIDLRDSVGGIGPIVIAPGRWSRGVGRRLMEACLEAADAKGKRVVMLQQVAANATSFSLYARLCFVPTETSLNFVGLVDSESGKEGLNIDGYIFRKLTAADAPVCDALFQRAMAPHPSGTFSRLHEIEGMLSQGGPTVYGLWSSSPDTDGRAAGETLAAFTTGAILGGHTVAASAEAFKVLLYSISQRLRDDAAAAAMSDPDPTTPTELNFYFYGRLYPELLPWLFNKAKLRLSRQLTGMAFGPPPYPLVQPAHSPGLIYCPSILY